MDYRIVIPARYASSRLPGKPLLDIAGKPMIWHTWQRALEAADSPRQVIIATDDDRIMQVCQDFGARVAMSMIPMMTKSTPAPRLIQ